jgi:threonine/homoserine/homoserine lactone efflux protein
LVVAIGFGPLIQRFPVLLLAVKFAGAAFLCWLGIQAIASRKRQDLVAPEGLGATDPGLAFRQGYVVGATNPKAFVVFVMIMPTFLDSHVHPVVLQMLVLAVVPIAIGIVSDSGWVLFSGLARMSLSGSARRTRFLSVTGGSLMIGLGMHLATS